MSSKYMFMIFIVTMHTWHDIIIRIFVPSMYIYLFCIFHLSISISIYLKRDDVMLANIFPWKQGHLLPPWIPSSLTTWTDQNKFAFPYQSRHQTYPKKIIKSPLKNPPSKVVWERETMKRTFWDFFVLNQGEYNLVKKHLLIWRLW